MLNSVKKGPSALTIRRNVSFLLFLTTLLLTLTESSDCESPELTLLQRVLRRIDPAPSSGADPAPSSRAAPARTFPGAAAAPVPDSDTDSPLLCLADRIRRRQQQQSSSRRPDMPPPSPQQPLIVVESDSSSNEDDSNGSPSKGPRKQLGNTVRRRVRRPNVIGSDSEEDDGDSPVGDRIKPAALKPPLRLDSGSESGGDASFVNIYEPGSYHKVRYSLRSQQFCASKSQGNELTSGSPELSTFV